MSSDEEYRLSEDEDDVELVVERENEVEPTEQNVVFEGENNENEQPNLDQDEKKEDNKKETKVKRTRNPQPKLDVERLRGPRGIRMLDKVFEDVQFKGRGHEEEDLTVLLKNYEYWCHRMFPKFPFDDCLEKMEKLGNKRYLQSFLKRIRLNMEDDEIVQEHLNDEIVNRDDSDAENNVFDNLLPPHTSQPNDSDSLSLTEEQLQRIAINREKAQRLRKQMLIKNRITDESVMITPSINHSSEDNEYNMRLSQVLNNCDGSNNINITNNSSQFIIEAEIHATDNGPLDKRDNSGRSMNIHLNTVQVNEPIINLSQISDICDIEESIRSTHNPSGLVQTKNNTHQDEITIMNNEVHEVVNMNDIETVAVDEQHENEKLTNECNRSRINASTVLDKTISQQKETLQQSDNKELSEDILTEFRNEEFDDIQTNVNQKDLLKKSDTSQYQKDNTSKDEDSLAMEIDM
ncbi:hypothetical protein ILUMI_09020 [Ignelater luminosus]|uniref:TIMELESS-interacting protein n=1 Tax=Ignelater luminosus TaxID=2038154 RepID=A0A8K0D392_IGNLU|nr:hypothetical protein ILUMI_09020 [Ignelater luminosus]